MRERAPLPPHIANAPDLQLGLELYYWAFFELSTTRPFGFAAGPISWTSIMDYARAYDFDEEQTEELIFFVREMDTEYLKFEQARAPKPRKSK